MNPQFPPLTSKNERYKYQGEALKATRAKSDLLGFQRLDLSSTAFAVVEARKSIWRIMVLISNTLAFVVLNLQPFPLKKQPNVLPSISLIMLLITLLYVIPLVLDFNAFLLGSHSQ